jgi:hypothetical protein
MRSKLTALALLTLTLLFLIRGVADGMEED